MVTLQALKAKIQKLTKQAEVVAKRERSGGVQRVVKLMQRLGVTVADLPKRGGGATKKAAGGVAKYRDPATGKTWTGHGRAPQWIKGAKSRDDFLIGGSASSSASAAPAKKAARKAAKAGTAAKRVRKSPAKAVKAVKAAKARKPAAARNGAAQAAT